MQNDTPKSLCARNAHRAVYGYAVCLVVVFAWAIYHFRRTQKNKLRRIYLNKA